MLHSVELVEENGHNAFFLLSSSVLVFKMDGCYILNIGVLPSLYVWI